MSFLYRRSWADTLAAACVAGLVALLLINPLAVGPSTAIWPNLFGLLAVGLILGLAAFTKHLLSFNSASHAALWLLALSVYVLIHSALLSQLSSSNFIFVFTAFAMFALGAALQLLPSTLVTPALASGVLLGAMINVLFGWLQFTQLAIHFSPWINQVAQPGVVYGNLRQPNQFASLMAMGIASLWWLVHHAHLTQTSTTTNRQTRHGPLTALLIVIFVSGIVLSGSRTGVLELFLIAFVAFLWRNSFSSTHHSKWLPYVFISLPLLYLLEWAVLKFAMQALDMAMTSGLDRFADTAGPSRRTLWHNVTQLIADKPVFGFGIHELGYAHFMKDFSALSWWPYQGRHMEFLDNAHNAFLHSWVELGLIGMLLSVGALLIGTFKAKPWRETRAPQQMAWFMIGVLTLHSMLEYPLHYAQFWLPFCLALSIAFTKVSSLDTGLNIPLESRFIAGKYNYTNIGISSYRYFFILLSSLCIACFAYAAWDYDRVSQAYNGPHRRAVPAGVDRVHEAQKSWLFAPYARFAKLMTTNVTADNAQLLLPQLRAMMHFSAEPRVLDKLLQALHFLAPQDRSLQPEIEQLEKQYAQVFPHDYARYRAASAQP